MSNKNYRLLFFLLVTMLGTSLGSSAQTTLGRVALGAFGPTGEDADVAETGLALQLTADVQISGKIGVEAELNWIPINLDSANRPVGRLIEARQIGAVAGFRLMSQALSETDSKPAAYVSARVGFSRIAVTSDTTTSVPGWIGRTLDQTQNLPPFSFPTRSTENAFVISPRAGFLLRPSPKAIIDISVAPAFLFDGGSVSRQIVATIGFGMLGRLD